MTIINENYFQFISCKELLCMMQFWLHIAWNHSFIVNKFYFFAFLDDLRPGVVA